MVGRRTTIYTVGGLKCVVDKWQGFIFDSSQYIKPAERANKRSVNNLKAMDLVDGV